MSTIAVLRSNFEGTHWKRAFAQSLMALRPDMNPDAADEVSDAEFARARDLEPGVAAHRWFDRQEPDQPSAPAASAG